MILAEPGKFGGDEVPGAKSHQEENALDELYQAVIMELSRRPHNKGMLDQPQISSKGFNPTCGDRVSIFATLNHNGILQRVTFEGKACAICTASSSLMTDVMQGKSLDEAGAIADRFKAMMRSEIPFEVFTGLPDMEALEGVRKFSVRIKCATLAWTTLKNGILEYKAGRGESSIDDSCATD